MNNPAATVQCTRCRQITAKYYRSTGDKLVLFRADPDRPLPPRYGQLETDGDWTSWTGEGVRVGNLCKCGESHTLVWSEFTQDLPGGRQRYIWRGILLNLNHSNHLLANPAPWGTDDENVEETPTGHY